MAVNVKSRKNPKISVTQGNQGTAAIIVKGGTVTALASLTDVDITGLSNNYALIYNSVTNNFEAKIIALGTHTDGDYVKDILSGNGIYVFNGVAEGSKPNVTLAPSGVTAGNYGNSSPLLVPVITVDEWGRVTNLYTSAVSNTQLLQSIIAVDGPGSGLDADTLDGLHGNVYALDADLTTANVTELNNLYFTQQRVKNTLSSNTGVYYNNTTGTFYLSQNVDPTSNVTFNNVTVNGTLYSNDITASDIVVAGNLTVQGTTTTVNTEEINLADNKVLLNSNHTGSATQDAGIVINRGSDPNTEILWDEGANTWKFTNNGTVYYLVPTSTTDLIEGANLYFTTQRARNSLFAGGNILYDPATGVISFDSNVLYTANVVESASNLYFTTQRARNSVSAGSNVLYNSSTGVISFDSNVLYTANVIESSSNLYYTNARARSAIVAGSNILYDSNTGTISLNSNVLYTANVVESASNLYFTTQRARDSVSAGSNILFDSNTGTITFDSNVLYTANVKESSSNLYYTNARAREAITVIDSGGDGSISYDSANGIITFTGPSASEVRAHFSTSTGLVYNNANGNFHLADTAVAPNVYGGGDRIPIITIDKQGRITSAANIAVAGVTSFTASGNTFTINTADGNVFSASIQQDSILLGRDTVGQYVGNLAIGTGVVITGLGNENTTPTIAIGQNVHPSEAVTFANVTAQTFFGNVSSGLVSSNNWQGIYTANVIETSGNLYFTTQRARNSVSAGQGVAYDSSTGIISINQNVDSTSNVTFNDVTVNGTLFSNDITASDIVVAGNLTVQGTTTTVNTEEINLADNKILLNSNQTGSATQDAGIIINRGSDPNVEVVWNETLNVWQFTNNGTNYYLVPTSTTDLIEGANLYYTNARARESITVVDTGGDGSLSYNSSNGTIIFTGPSPSEVRAHLNTSTGLFYNNSNGNFHLTDTPVTPNTYGGATQIPVLTIDKQGRITSAGNTTVAGVTSYSVSGNTFTINTADGNTFSASIQPESILLSRDTVGEYVGNLVAGTGVVLANLGYENTSPTISIGQNVHASEAVTFANVTAQTFFGNVDAKIITSKQWQGIYTANVIETSGNLYFTNVRAREAISNSTGIVYETSNGTIILADTTVAPGTYGNAITIPVITVDQQGRLSNVNTVLVAGVSAFTANGNSFTISTADGNSFVANIQPNSIVLGRDTTGAYVSNLVAGTGVTISPLGDETTVPTVSIGQNVDPALSVTFANVTAHTFFGNANGLTAVFTQSVNTDNIFADNVYASSANISYIESDRIVVTGNLSANGYIATSITTEALFSNTIHGTSAEFSGYVSAANISSQGNIVSSGVFVGNGSGLTNIQNQNIIGLTTANVVELNNLYFTTQRARDSISAGTGVFYNNTSGIVSIGQNVSPSANVTFSELNVTGNANFYGPVTTHTSNNLSISDNMIYLNSNNTISNPDIGFVANYNDGSYHHTGFFRDASDGKWKVFDNYDLEPDANIFINTSHASFRLADYQGNTFYGNLVGNVSGYINSIDNFTTSNLLEGVNLYFTNVRAQVIVEPAYNQANAAYNQANTATTYATSAYDKANTATTFATSAFNQANTATTFATSSYDQANTATAYATSAYNQANTATTFATSAFNQANTATTQANTATTYATAAYDQANTATTFATSAFNQANTATTYATAAFDSGNTKVATVAGVSNVTVYNVQLTAGIVETGVLNTSNVIEGANLYYTDARVYANVANILPAYATVAHVTSEIANVIDFAPAALDTLNELAQALGNSNNFATVTLSILDSAYTQANTATTYATAAYNQANIATTYATAAFNSGNTKVATVAGVSNVTIYNVEIAAGITQTGILNTSNVVEGANLYFTNTRAVNAVTQTTLSNLTIAGSVTAGNINISGLYTGDGGGLSNIINSSIVGLTTANVIELVNLYFTVQRARDSISAGAGILYNNTTGVVRINPDEVTGGTDFADILIFSQP